jgi:hypothetical protein
MLPRLIGKGSVDGVAMHLEARAHPVTGRPSFEAHT